MFESASKIREHTLSEKQNTSPEHRHDLVATVYVWTVLDNIENNDKKNKNKEKKCFTIWFDDRVVSGQSVAWEDRDGRKACLSAKICAGMQTKHSSSMDKTQLCSLGGNLTFWGRSWGLGQAQVSCQRQELWCSRIHRDVYLYFPVPASITLLKPVVTLTPGILLLAEKTFHFTALCKITFKPGMAKIISNERLRKIIQCRT